MFVNAAVAATSQREFRTGGDAQRMSLDFLHEYVRTNYRGLYAATLALDINDHNAARIIEGLLTTAAADRVEGRLIARRLQRLPPQRVYRLILQLRAKRVNNRRTRAVVRDWVAARPDLAFDAVKYRRGLAAAAGHAHLRLPDEVGAVLYDWRSVQRYRTPILEAWRKAHYDQRAVYELPYTVAEGFAAKHGIDRQRFLAGIRAKLTARERMRLDADLGAATLTRLASYVLSLGHDERRRRRDELTEALRQQARRAAGAQAGTWGSVVGVLDDSYSSSGSAVKRQRPLGVALGTHYLLEALSPQYNSCWINHRGDPLLVRAAGPTRLGERILDGLAMRPDRLVIVSDGWDNAPPGLAAEVLRVWRERLDRDGGTEVVHLNPVYDSETFDVRRLAPEVPTVGVRDAEDAAALVELARFGAGTASLGDLRAHLAARVERFLQR
ncbi:hypothetical protein ABZS66_28615 [Dactylosporangium sp. NPDC005572]|uniref:hypothetical protein n=1 Tax=Dactylosporangium sp. NPDC005572 TaxID=3156889 RepID=UPI0033AC5EDC